MSNIHRLGVHDQKFGEASVWIARMDKGLTQSEEEELRHWLAADSRNRQQFLEMTELWDKMEVLSRLSDIVPHSINRATHIPWFSVAASLLLVLSAGYWSLAKNTASETSESPTVEFVAESVGNGHVYETAIGEQSKISLSDGTELILNTNTLVHVAYSNKHRLLTLDRGEFHVQVASNKFRPLSVIAKDKIIQAVGTAFNVEINDDNSIELLVTTGTVRVSNYRPDAIGDDPDFPIALPASATLVSAGEQTVLEKPDVALETIRIEDIAVKLSWREGNLIFRGESLEEALKEVGRYTEVEFVILDERSRNVSVAGLFRAGDVNGLLASLEKNFGVTHRRVGDNIIELSGQ